MTLTNNMSTKYVYVQMLKTIIKKQQYKPL